MTPPLPLEPGETVVLSGGRSWHCWLYSLAFAPMLCMLLPVPVLPYLLSGRYWLTQRRLLFKSPLGQPRSVRLNELTGLEVTATRATLTLDTRQGGLTVRFAEHFHRLWGALALFSELPVPQQVSSPQVKFLASPATARFPGGWQQGFAVSFDRRVVFLPNEKPRRTAVEAGKVVGQLALALAGVHVHSAQAQLPFDLWLSLWSHLSTEEFAALLQSTAEARGGRVLPLEQLEVVSPQQFKAGEWSVSARQPLLG